MTITSQIATLEQIIKDSQATLAKTQQEIKNYQQLVREGKETLGTPIDDFVFVWHSDNRQYWHGFYSALASLCKEDTPILFEHTFIGSRLLSTRRNGPNEYTSELYTTQKMGILSGSPSYNIRKGQVIFPVDSHIEKDNKSFSSERINTITGPIIVPVSSFQNYGKYVDYQHVQGDSSAMPNDHSMKISFGSKEEYVKRKSEYAPDNQSNQKDNYGLLFQKFLIGFDIAKKEH